MKSAKLILDGNHPELDEFGDLIGGVHSPHFRSKGETKLMLEIACSVELVKERPDKWRLYPINGRELRISLRVATRDSIADGGPARLVVLDPEDRVTAGFDYA